MCISEKSLIFPTLFTINVFRGFLFSKSKELKNRKAFLDFVSPKAIVFFHFYFSSDAQAFMSISDESYISAFLFDHPSPKCQENSKGQFFPSWTGTPH